MAKALLTGLFCFLGLGCASETLPDHSGDVAETSAEEIGATQDDITGLGAFDGYMKSLVRLDFAGGGRCSAVLVGPNLLVTAAHCVDDNTIDGVTNWDGMKYGKVQVRMVYKPTASETMCFNETCRNADGSARYSTVYAFWDGGYSGSGDWSSDFAVLTRVTQSDFVTKAGDPGAAAPRSLGSADFLRIQKGTLPTDGDWIMTIAGYGAPADGQSTSNPRMGYMDVNDWNTSTMVANYNSGIFWASTCQGDSGGPISYTAGIGGRTYLGGITLGTNDSVSGSCPETGDDIVFGRTASKIWLLNNIRQWIEDEDCTLYVNTADLPGSGEYYRCW